jgi:DNA repair protein RecO (recombination protein O)
MQISHTQGLIFKVIDFREYDQIMTVFTPDKGIVKWIFKIRKPSKTSPRVKISPLMQGEFTYSETKGEIWKCRELIIYNYYLKLRGDYSLLESAGRMINTVIDSQPLHKPAPKLYKQLITYLEKIPFTTNLPALELSFILKILKNEGVANTHLQCSVCQNLLQSLYIWQGEHFCAMHAPAGALLFNEDETLAWMQLAACSSFSQLNTIYIPEHLPHKAHQLFKMLVQH